MDSSTIVYVSVKNLPFSELYWTSLLSLLGHAQSLALVPPALPLLISTIFNMVFIHFYNEMLVGFKECLLKFKFNSFDHDFVMNHCALFITESLKTCNIWLCPRKHSAENRYTVSDVIYYDLLILDTTWTFQINFIWKLQDKLKIRQDLQDKLFFW